MSTQDERATESRRRLAARVTMAEKRLVVIEARLAIVSETSALANPDTEEQDSG